MNAKASISVVPTKADIPPVFHRLIIGSCEEALQDHDFFTIALSGGSVPSFLKDLAKSFEEANVDPQFTKWHVCLADERIVPLDDDDSNYKAIVDVFNADPSITVPSQQLYSIDETLLNKNNNMTPESGDTTEIDAAVSKDYEDRVILPLLKKLGGAASEKASYLTKSLDCIVLGFGPDGHTCSLFPNHPLLEESERFVAYIQDSPKPPPRRITLTFPVVKHGKRIIVCGSGSSKGPIVSKIFPTSSVSGSEKSCSENGKENLYENVPITTTDFPISHVHALSKSGTVHWILDAEAAQEFE